MLVQHPSGPDEASPVDAPLGRETDVDAPRRPRRSSFLLNVTVVSADVLAVVIAVAAAYALRGRLPGPDPADEASSHLIVVLAAFPVWILVFTRYHLYSSRHVGTRREEFSRITHTVAASILAALVISFLIKRDVSRGWLALTFLLGVVAVAVERETVRRVLITLRRHGRLQRPVVVVGSNEEARAVIEMLRGDRPLGYVVVETIAVNDEASRVGTERPDPWCIVMKTLHTVMATHAHGVIIVSSAISLETANVLARALTDCGIHVELSSALRDIVPERLSLRILGRFAMVYVAPVRRTGWRRLAKRAFDLVFATTALLLTLPVMAIAALAIRLDSRGPILFRQKRVGMAGKSFELLKLRSMVSGAASLFSEVTSLNEADGCLFKTRNDPRVTRVGRVLREFSIDELPQLWNVIKGEMSLVGPRPALPHEAMTWTPQIRQRLRVKPGITGLWQVNGRSDLSFADYVRFDLQYVDNWSLMTDLSLLARTLPAVLARRGAR